MAEYTPMMKQYFEIKKQYSDCILMYRLGDFYEMFFDDAKIASKVLELVLTGKDCGQEERAPMCGVPFHAVDSYISKLVAAGHKVAICEQTEDPKAAKGIVKRDVVRIVTPGTIMDSGALTDDKNNYLCSVYVDESGAGVSFVDITTGEIVVFDCPEKDYRLKVLNEMSRLEPAEVIVNLRAYEDTKLTEEINRRFGCSVVNYYNWAYEADYAKNKISEQFGDKPDALDIADKTRAAASLGALITYLGDTQKTELSNIKEYDVELDEKYMKIDMFSLRNLELVETIREKKSKGSLFYVLNKTETAMGGRLLRKWITKPSLSCAEIQRRHMAVDELLKQPLICDDITEALKSVQDIERIISRVMYKTVSCKELLAISSSLSSLPRVYDALKRCKSRKLSDIAGGFDTLSDVKNMIDASINPEAPATLREGGLIKTGYDAEIDRLRSAMRDGAEWIRNIAEEEREKNGIKNIKVGYNRVFGYYIEVSKGSISEVPDYFIRRQTLANAERYITPRIKEIEETVTQAREQIVTMEYDVFCRIRDAVAEQSERICKTAALIAEIDVLCSLAEVAEKNNYVMPSINMSDKIIIKDGRHPVIEQINKKNIFIPNDVSLDCGSSQISIITGPNMAGKSTYMRQIALIVIMAQMGSFVPASYAEIGLVDKIFTRVGASDDLAAGQSTFMVEMSEVAYILDNVTKNSLVILDEIGRGTSTYDGLGIAWAVVEYIADKKKCGAKTLFATHYHELTELEEKIPNVKNFCIAAKKKGDDITFLRKIIRGGADESYGVEVAALAGVKKSVIRRAKEIVAALDGKDDVRLGVQNAGAEKAQPSAQLEFSGFEDSEIISELKALDLNTMTPMEAQAKLFYFQAKAKNG